MQPFGFYLEAGARARTLLGAKRHQPLYSPNALNLDPHRNRLITIGTAKEARYSRIVT